MEILSLLLFLISIKGYIDVKLYYLWFATTVHLSSFAAKHEAVTTARSIRHMYMYKLFFYLYGSYAIINRAVAVVGKV